MIEAMQVFDGAILGDAGLYLPHERGSTYFGINLSHPEHIDWLIHLKTALDDLRVEACANHPKVGRGISHNKPYSYCTFRTKVSQFLTVQHSRWYAGEVKIVPKDIQLTPIVLANWFMGDGSTHKYTPRPQNIYLKLSTHSFEEAETRLLMEKLENVGLDGFGVYRDPACNRGWYLMAGRRLSVNKFLDRVEPYIVPSFTYKIKRPFQVIRKGG